MHSRALVELALQTLSCSQKELALRLGVSPTQISKWKKDEHMSLEMEEKIRAMVDIGDKDPQFVLWAGSIEDADKWDRLIHFLAEDAIDEAETGYDTVPLQDELGLLCAETFDTLRQMGVEIPKPFPTELDIKGENDDLDDVNDYQDENDVLYTNAYAVLIKDIFLSLNDVYGFYAAYVSELVCDDDLELLNTAAENIEPCLIHLAACKVEVDEQFAPKFKEFKYQWMKDYTEWLTIVKDRAFRAGVPLKAELLEMVADSAAELGQTAEAEALGFNSGRIHPDIYMNELLIGMRVIHQVLPAIMKKLGIEDEFKLDTSELSIK